MPKVSASPAQWLQATIVRLSRIHFFIVPAYVAVIVVYDAWHVLTPQAVLQRWTMIGIFLGVVAIIWAAARFNVRSAFYYQSLAYLLILLDISFATFNIYTQRGMASRAVILFTIPLAVAAALRSRTTIFATAALCAVAYTTAAVRYFVVNFNEGYKVELYGEILFYSAMLFVVAALLWLVVRTNRTG